MEILHGITISIFVFGNLSSREALKRHVIRRFEVVAAAASETNRSKCLNISNY